VLCHTGNAYFPRSILLIQNHFVFETARCLFVTQKVPCPLGELKIRNSFFMDDFKKLKGRPKLKEDKRCKFINVRFTEAEFNTIGELEKNLGITKTELIRLRVLSTAKQTIVNSSEVIKHLDWIGGELGRIGNNINQLARHTNVLNLQGRLNPSIVEDFNLLFQDYILVQQSVETSMRKIIRVMGS
jgi:hypothetical protein